MKECKQRQYHHNNSPALLCSLSFFPNFWTSQTPNRFLACFELPKRRGSAVGLPLFVVLIVFVADDATIRASAI
jgi:hypothetical protein